MKNLAGLIRFAFLEVFPASVFCLPENKGFLLIFFWGGGGVREGYGVYTSPKKPKMALITDPLPADLSPDASADAPPRINIR